MAARRKWDDGTRLDHLLPKLQGKAGDFVYTQLPRRTLTNYNDLIKELNRDFEKSKPRKHMLHDSVRERKSQEKQLKNLLLS